jgi:hypothetical protein
MATASQPTDRPSDQSANQPDSSASPALDSLAPPSLLDDRRYCANRAGRSVAEIAQEQQVSEQEILASINRVRLDNERFSPSAAGVAARRLLFAALPKIQLAVDEALSATKFHGKKVVMIDKETGEAVTMEETVERPDHDIRLRTMSEVRQFFSVVQPRDPAVQIVSNSQTNILNQGAGQQAQAGNGLTSPEAVIRHIQMERQRALTSGSPVQTVPLTTTLEGEPVMARNRSQEELEADPDEEEEEGDDIEEDESEEDEED